MEGSFDFWFLIGGLGLFLFGMNVVETALRGMAGRNFKVFLRKHTENKLKAIASGALVTALLQSSSVVSLIMLAFVGAEVVSMQNALAVVLGANLGTTLDSWVVATIGFNFEIERFALPMIGISGILLVLFNQNKKIEYASYFTIGVGLLFLGLGYMKDSVGSLVENLNLQDYADQPLIILVGIGFVVTAIIQSSSATLAITLTALYANALTLEQAAAVVVGANLGTTIKLLISATGGHASKKRVALGNFIFNVTVTLIAFILLKPIISFISSTMAIRDDLISLVLFQSSINLIGIVLFFPFLKKFTRFLERWFIEKDPPLSIYLSKVSPDVPEAVEAALEKETLRFIRLSIRYGLRVFDFKETTISSLAAYQEKDNHQDTARIYENLKKLEGEIAVSYAQVGEQNLSSEEKSHMLRLVGAVRSAMHSAKSMKDISHDLEDLTNSPNEFRNNQYNVFRIQAKSFLIDASELLEMKDRDDLFKAFYNLQNKIKSENDEYLKSVYLKIKPGIINDVELSTLLNVSREIFLSGNLLLESIDQYLLEKQRVIS